MDRLLVTLCLCGLLAQALALAAPARAADEPWLHLPAGDGAKGKRVVLISGDEEYRSEEALPMLGKILAQRHGLECTVLFAIDPATGQIAPNHGSNIPGLEALRDADLMIIFTRFRGLPDEQMKLIDDYLKSGRPVIGLRTATHAFAKLKGEYARYNNGYNGPEQAWRGGFGRLVLGEKWVNHHGHHKHESTRGIIPEDAGSSPILNGIKCGEIWGSTDVYTINLPLPGDSKPVLLGQVVERKGAFDPNHVDFGMMPTDDEPVAAKNNPMMPVAWTRTFQLPDGKPGRAFTCTMGSGADFANEGLRRLMVNAVYSLLDLPVPSRADVSYVGEYRPTAYGMNGYAKGKTPASFK